MRVGKVLGAVCCCFLATAGFAATVQQDVSPGNLDGWSASVTGSSTADFVNGPATPPCGTGSAQLSVDSSGTSEAMLANTNYNGTMLNSLTALGFSTFVQANNAGGQAVYLVLQIDYNNDNIVDDQLVFEPRYNSAQGTVATNTWQTWDALAGNWWSQNGIAGATPGTPQPLSAYITAQPNARIVNTSTGAGGVQLVAGRGSAADWANFVGNVDCFTIGVSGGDTTTFDFELDADNDGVPDNQDQCLSSDMRPNVDVNGDAGGATSITNVVNAQGCTIQDQVNECANGATNHGQYVSCIAQLANSLRQSGAITNAQSKEMKTGAAQSDIGKSNNGGDDNGNGNGHGNGKGKGKGKGHGHGHGHGH